MRAKLMLCMVSYKTNPPQLTRCSSRICGGCPTPHHDDDNEQTSMASLRDAKDIERSIGNDDGSGTPEKTDLAMSKRCLLMTSRIQRSRKLDFQPTMSATAEKLFIIPRIQKIFLPTLSTLKTISPLMP
ncbi:MAG: hypothetical protein FRX48_02445 [Lasallia pustulata]|uniref:Uncharacterized protein n=1 Tax=Lasallia pustulata TaxID=136370 RepID=A0A5M8PWN4_9LECA|nr:MAG: hypothetical protein FRX48_02445 [Lasallia pustulata]